MSGLKERSSSEVVFKTRAKLVQSADNFLLPSAVQPGEVVDIELKMKAPNEVGCYPTVWCISLPNGEIIRRAVVKIKVIGDQKSADVKCRGPRKNMCKAGGKWTKVVNTLVDMGFEKNQQLFKLVGKHKFDVNAVVEELTREKM